MHHYFIFVHSLFYARTFVCTYFIGAGYYHPLHTSLYRHQAVFYLWQHTARHYAVCFELLKRFSAH